MGASGLMSWTVLRGDVSEILPEFEDGSFDAVLCDPPYGLSFMGKAWDHGVPSAEVWEKTLRLLKPGAHLIAFGGTRTFHRLAVGIEDAGFEIRDCLSWLYGQGFPKSRNLKGDFQGYGTALKPAWEPAILAMKPTRGTFAQNALEHGVAGLNVDGCRIWTSDTIEQSGEVKTLRSDSIHAGYERPGRTMFRTDKRKERSGPANQLGRWPANVVLDEEAAALLDEQSGETRSPKPYQFSGKASGGYSRGDIGNGIGHESEYGDSGGASRFFYCAKASRGEREAGLEGFEAQRTARGNGAQAAVRRGEEISRADVTSGMGATGRARNHHPTVKPIKLCEWLARLLLPPKRDTPRRILVPFSGSGSEMIGALLAGWDEVVGIELEPDYAEIAEARLRHWVGTLEDKGEQQADLFGEQAV